MYFLLNMGYFIAMLVYWRVFFLWLFVLKFHAGELDIKLSSKTRFGGWAEGSEVSKQIDQ